jgi:hypothetical protein
VRFRSSSRGFGRRNNRSAPSGLRVVAEDTDWGRELSSAVVRVGAGVLMVHNGLDKLVDPEVRRERLPSDRVSFHSLLHVPARSFAETGFPNASRNPNAKPTDHENTKTQN